jgi:signal transduction histidine kinase
MEGGLLKFTFLVCLWLIFTSCNCEKEPTVPDNVFLEKEKSFFSNYGLVKKPLKFSIALPRSDKTQYLVIENPHINRINLSFSKREAIWDLGDHMNFGERPINFRQFAIPIPSLNEFDTLFMEVDKSEENLSLGLRIFDENSFQEYQRQDDRIIGFSVGIIALAILIGVILMPAIFAKKTVLFLLFIFFSLFWLLNDAGLFFQYFWPNNPLFHSVSRGLFSTISMGLFAFYVYQNKHERINNTIKKIFIGIVIFIVIKLIFSFVLSLKIFPDSVKGYYISINSITLLLLFGLLMILLAKELINKRGDFFEMGAIFIYCTFVFSLALSELGISLIRIPFLHQFDSLIFLGLQLFFMTIHIKKEETRQKLKSLQEFSDFQIFQERHLKNRIIAVEEFERERIAQNIHDDVGSILAAIKYLILSLQEKWRIKEILNDFIPILNLLDEGVKNQYSIIDDLISKFDEGESLALAVKKKIDMIFSEGSVESEVLFLVSENALSNHQKKQLFRIFTELITNTLKHANGTTFVSIRMMDTYPIEVSYSDNGNSSGATAVSSKGKGLENIKFRIDQLQGTLQELKLHQGFFIAFTIPRSNE